MSIPGSAAPFLLASEAAPAAYEIERSLRFNSSDSAYLSRTPSTAGNRKTWTWAAWVKRSGLGRVNLFNSYSGSLSESTYTNLQLGTGDNLIFGSAFVNYRTTTQVFRDASAWYHIVVTVDTTQSTANNRVRIYVNGEELTQFSTTNNPSQNADLAVNAAFAHRLGSEVNQFYFNGYLASVHLIDGQALDPTSFGEFDDNGIWQPKAYTGSYGTNGFHLDFSDNSTAAALGTDTSGNGNTWTVSNISVASGIGNDSMVDVPTNGTETDTGIGGEVRGNYCTLNSLAETTTGGGTFSQGNLRYVGPSAWRVTRGTFNFPASGKWYYEATLTGTQFNVYGSAGFGEADYFRTWSWRGVNQVIVQDNGAIYEANTLIANITPSSNGVLGIAIDRDANAYKIFWNNVEQVSRTIPFSSGVDLTPSAASYNADYGTWEYNFGQRPFAYTAPSGFKALCTANLPAPVVAKPSEVMDVKLYTGNGNTQTISGLGFSPDLVVIQARSQGDAPPWTDTVRGASKSVFSSSTAAETTVNSVTAFNSDGFTVGNYNNVNQNAITFVAWAWDAGSSTVTNTQGSITSTVRANPTAGFSIVTYTGNGSAGATVGHGLNLSPGFYVVKRRNAANDWECYHSALGATYYGKLNATDAWTTSGGTSRWNDTEPTSSVFSLGTTDNVNGSGSTYVAYCFAPVDGYSSFGSYTGNGSTDGPFVYTGFRPKFLLVKLSSGSIDDWFIQDTTRSPYNVSVNSLSPNNSNAESSGTFNSVDILSNGFKPRDTNQNFNGSGYTYIYAAFAENPFQYARAR